MGCFLARDCGFAVEDLALYIRGVEEDVRLYVWLCCCCRELMRCCLEAMVVETATRLF
jgi:hypothetical protein